MATHEMAAFPLIIKLFGRTRKGKHDGSQGIFGSYLRNDILSLLLYFTGWKGITGWNHSKEKEVESIHISRGDVWEGSPRGCLHSQPVAISYNSFYPLAFVCGYLNILCFFLESAFTHMVSFFLSFFFFF